MVSHYWSPEILLSYCPIITIHTIITPSLLHGMKISFSPGCDFLNITVSKTKIFKIPCFVHLSTPQIKNKDEFDFGLILTAL